MKKTLLSIILTALLLSSLSASADLILPDQNCESFTLISNESGDEFIVDDTVFYKSVLDGTFFVNRFSDHTVLLESRWNDIIMMYGADEEEIDSVIFSLSYSTESPVLILFSTPADDEMIEELSPEMIYITPSLSNSERAMLRRSGTSFAEIDPSSVLRFNDDGSIQVISGEASYKEGIYVTCPNCGTMIYVTLPY